MIDYGKLGGLLKAHRKKAKLSQPIFGRLVEEQTGEPFPVARISYMENGKQYPGNGEQPEYRASVAYYLQYLYPFYRDNAPRALGILLSECWIFDSEK